jgi:hypothetical protein
VLESLVGCVSCSNLKPQPKIRNNLMMRRSKGLVKPGVK